MPTEANREQARVARSEVDTDRLGEANRATGTGRDQPADHEPGETNRETRRLGQQYTVQEAAEILGTTVDAVRGRIRRGTLDSTKFEGVVYVLLDAPGREQHTDQPKAAAGAGWQPTADQPELVGELRDQIDWLRREVERKDTIIMSLTQRVPELEPVSAPRGSFEATAEGQAKRSSDAPPDTQEPMRQRSWLYRFFFGP